MDSVSGDPLKVDMGEWRALTRNLKNSSPTVYAAIRKAMRPAMLPVAAEARKRAGFSDRIPGSVTVGSRGAVGFVQAGGKRAPDAAPLEHGGRSGTFRHPVFGRGDRANWKWVNQPAKPFLHPAADEAAPAVADVLLKAVTEAIAESLSEGL